MRRDAWKPLSPSRSTKVWDRFDEAFQFRPSVDREDWPSFREATPSVTWHIRTLLETFNPWRDSEATPYNQALLTALQQCLAPDEPVLALDWQHASYEFYPHRLRDAGNPATWYIPALPSGEYHLFVTEDHRLGSLGHPWEGTLCIFGEGFVDAYLRVKPPGLDQSLRRQVPDVSEQTRREPKRGQGQSCPRPGSGRRRRGPVN
jgi:hypothetical protein